MQANIPTTMINFDSLLFNIDFQQRLPGPGSLLVAEPFLREKYFHHSVICLVDYEPGGSAMGIVLNRQTGTPLQSLISGITVERPIPVFCGGPMSCDRLYFIHSLGSIIPGSKPIADSGLYIGGSFEAMTDYVNSGYPVEGCIRFFIGYSGWSERQLDEEIGNNVWAVAETPSAEMVLTAEEDAYWHRTVRAMGDDYRGWLFHPWNIHAN